MAQNIDLSTARWAAFLCYTHCQCEAASLQSSICQCGFQEEASKAVSRLCHSCGVGLGLGLGEFLMISLVGAICFLLS
jgi:hypothetical protein